MATLKDIAKEIGGVDVSTVSRALNNSSEISEATKALVRKTAAALNYMPDPAARALVGKPTKSVGLIVPEVSSDYYGQMANAVEAELRLRGYSMIMGTSEFRYELELDCLNTFSSRKVDGIILIGCMHPRLRTHLDRVRDSFGIPIILMDPIGRIPGYDHLIIDNRVGIGEAVSFFCEHGRTRIAFVGDRVSSRSRFPTFRAALQKNHYDLQERYVKVTQKRFEEGGYEGMGELLKELPPPDAVFAAYDDMAIGALKAIYEAGLSVPKDVTIIGYDNVRHGEYLYQPLSTIFPNLTELTKAGVSLLMDRIGAVGPDRPISVRCKSRLILRSTTHCIDTAHCDDTNTSTTEPD